MGYLQNIQSFETSVETGNLQRYEKQSIMTAVKVTLQRWRARAKCRGKEHSDVARKCASDGAAPLSNHGTL